MRFVTRLLAAALFVATVIPGSTFAKPHPPLPSLAVQGDDGTVALALDALRIEVLIRGHLARTTYELTYRNSLATDIDGDFTFPLPPGAETTDLALQFNGKWRHAVAVERVQARAAYEQTVHRRLDPALAEWSASGNVFRFRVYPIPANGTKSVRLSYDQELTSAPYELDLHYGVKLAAFDLTIDSDDARIDSDRLGLRRTSDGWSAHVRDALLDGSVRATRADAELALTAWSPDDKQWYASAPIHIRSSAPAVAPASRLVLLVDSSASAAQRDARKLDAFVEAFVAQQQRGAGITIVPFHIASEAPLHTDAASVARTIDDLPAAGATDLAALLERLPQIVQSDPTARILLITDGINSLGDSRRLARAVDVAAKLRVPLTVVNASATADDHFLGSLARATGGWSLDLAHVDAAEAASNAMRQPVRVDLGGGFPALRDVEPASLLAMDDLDATVNARSPERIFAFPLITTFARHEVPVRELRTTAEQDLVRRAWARARLRALLDRDAPAAEVLAHGRAFTQLTPRTSLLVLDSWQAYEQYGIPLSPELREERDAEEARARAQAKLYEQSKHARQQAFLRAALPKVPDAVWYVQGIASFDDTPLPGATISLAIPDTEILRTVTAANGRYLFVRNRVPPSFTLTAELDGFAAETREFPHGAPKGTIINFPMRIVAVAESISVTASAPAMLETAEVASNLTSGTPLAERLLGPNDSDDDDVLSKEAVAKRIDSVQKVVAKLRSLSSTADRFRYYLAARAAAGSEKLFHAEAALAIRDDSPELAVRLLTDLAEAWPDDAATLRLIGRVLDGWGRGDLARLLFERAHEIAPNEEQTARELALLEAKEQRGADMRIDAKAELQVELMWDSNFTDVDLHVTEPGGEEVYFQHMSSREGGQLDHDITTGFGPETYTIPRMARGDYKISLHYFRPDNTRASLETLAHVIVYVDGRREDHFVTLTAHDDDRAVATVRR